MLTMISAIANNGTAVSPYLVEEITTPEGKVSFSAENTVLGEYFTTDTAQELDEMLRSNVKNQYGDSYFPKMKMCGKTGTAEISDNPDTNPNALFVGYSQLPEMPFAIIVIAENSKYSMSTAVPVASKVMKAVEKEYANLKSKQKKDR